MARVLAGEVERFLPAPITFLPCTSKLACRDGRGMVNSLSVPT